jgi:sulfite reductase alpha subunit-like flavoprotein
MTQPKPRVPPEIDLEAIFLQRRAEQEEWQRRAVEAQAQAAHAYARLLGIAETSDTGQAGRVAQFVASTFNGHAYTFDLFDLRNLDVAISDDMLLCLDALRWGKADLYKLVPDGEQRVKSIVKLWQIKSALEN